MKILVLLLSLTSLLYADAVLEQSFDSSTPFPPAGWTASYSGTAPQMSWAWSNTGQPGNGYAKGLCITTYPPLGCSGIITLTTSNFSLSEGDVFKVTFRKLCFISVDGGAYGGYMKVKLFQGGSMISEWDIPFTWGSSAPWEEVSYTLDPIPITADDYQLQFGETTWLISPNSYVGGNFWLDDIYAEDNLQPGSKVEATSVGNLKALYQ